VLRGSPTTIRTILSGRRDVRRPGIPDTVARWYRRCSSARVTRQTLQRTIEEALRATDEVLNGAAPSVDDVFDELLRRLEDVAQRGADAGRGDEG
jgi:hypothetical protein